MWSSLKWNAVAPHSLGGPGIHQPWDTWPGGPRNTITAKPNTNMMCSFYTYFQYISTVCRIWALSRSIPKLCIHQQKSIKIESVFQNITERCCYFYTYFQHFVMFSGGFGETPIQPSIIHHFDPRNYEGIFFFVSGIAARRFSSLVRARDNKIDGADHSINWNLHLLGK